MPLVDRMSIPLLDKLIPGGVKPGTAFAVEFDSDSQWFAVATSIAARAVMNGAHLLFASAARPADQVKQELMELGADVFGAVKTGKLLIDDWYSGTLTGGRLLSSSEPEHYGYGTRIPSLKVADFSVEQMKVLKGLSSPWQVLRSWPPGGLLVFDSLSVLMRFNDERAFLEWLESRERQEVHQLGRINLEGYVRGLHSEQFYKRLETASEGILDVRVMEQDRMAKNFIRLRALKGQPHDNAWHEIEVRANGETTLIN